MIGIGGATAPLPVEGDVDGNGMVEVADAVLVLKSISHLGTLTPAQLKTADVNGDGVVNVQDVILILRKAIGL